MHFLIVVISFGALLGSMAAFADPPAPTVDNNVHVLRNTSPSQCTSTWDGSGGFNTQESVSGYGQSNSMGSTSVQSCTGCAFEASSRDCVCKACYTYTN